MDYKSEGTPNIMDGVDDDLLVFTDKVRPEPEWGRTKAMGKHKEEIAKERATRMTDTEQ